MEPSVQVALLRGVNVGGRARVAMGALAAMVEDLGYTEVRSLLNSGNLVFENASGGPEQAATGISQAIEVRLGLEVRVMVRTAAELEAVVQANPLSDVAADGSRYFVAFLSAVPEAGRAGELVEADWGTDRAVVLGREAYLWCPNGARDTRLTTTNLERRLGVAATARNWNTVTRLLALCRQRPAVPGQAVASRSRR